MKTMLSFFWEIGKIVGLAALIVIPIRYFVFQPFLVRGNSMEPNFHNGDYLIIDELSYRFGEPQRGEVVVFKFPGNPSQRYIKRIAGLPRETIQIKDGTVRVLTDSPKDTMFFLDETEYLPEGVITPGDVEIRLAENEYFVLGDNRLFSSDSRKWGLLPADYIIGRVLVRVFPLDAFAKVETPTY